MSSGTVEESTGPNAEHSEGHRPLEEALMPPATTTVLELAANHPETNGEKLPDQAQLIPQKLLLVTEERAVTFRQMEGTADGIACGYFELDGAHETRRH